MRKIVSLMFLAILVFFGVSSRVAAAEKSRWSFDAGNDVTTSYYFRGILQQNQGFITQPYADAYFQLTDSIKVWGGVWNSIHDKVAPGLESPEHWYEFDALAGIEMSAGPLTMGVTYILYNSPSNAFDDIHEIEVKLSVDDSAVMKGTPLPALNPSFSVAFEVRDKTGTEDVYAQAGIEPSFEGKIGKVPVTVAFPLVFGFSFDDYYTDKKGKNDFFGYVSTGVSVSTPLPLPGNWTLTGSVQYLYLDAFSLRAANNLDSSEVIGTVGIGVEF